MMNFRTIKQALISLLGAKAAGRFQTIGWQSQSQGAQEFLGTKRTVQVYYAAGDFPKSSGRYRSSVQHAMTFGIGFTVSAASRLDLSVINNPNATQGQIAGAMVAMQDAANLADASFDELAEIIYQIIMDGLNIDLGLPVGTMADRWVESIKKDSPLPQGSRVLLTGELTYSCQTVEEVTGDTGVPLAPGGIGTTVDIPDDDVEQAGVNAPSPIDVPLGGEI